MQDIFGFPCFSINPLGSKFFGFSEYLAALALMVIAWTLADVKYKFRINTAIFPIFKISYFLLAFVGLAALVTDLWRAGGRCVIEGDFITPSSWQAVMGLIFLSVFLTWIWFSFMSPSKFGRMNSFRYWTALRKVVLKSSPEECREIGDELARSAESIVRHAWTEEDFFKVYGDGTRKVNIFISIWNLPRFNAEKILSLIGDVRFCKFLVRTSSITILEIFSQIRKQGKNKITIGVFARNITIEALNFKDSFIYNEAGSYFNGSLAFERNFSNAIYGSYELVESMRYVYDIFHISHKWDAEQWEAYFRVVLITFEDYVKLGVENNHSTTFSQIMDTLHLIGDPVIDLNKVGSDWHLNDEYKKFKFACKFLKDLIESLNSDGSIVVRKIKKQRHVVPGDVFEDIACAIYQMMVYASKLKVGVDYCFYVQVKAVWNSFFASKTPSNVERIIRFKVRRMIYDEIVFLKRMPNYEGANLLGMMMGIAGFNGDKSRWDGEMWNFYRLVLFWVKRNYISLVSENSVIAEACLSEGIEYDIVGKRLVKKTASFAGRPPNEQVLDLHVPQA